MAFASSNPVIIIRGEEDDGRMKCMDDADSSCTWSQKMIPGIYSAATAMDNAALRHQLVARNLANMNVPGFRRMTVSQKTFESTLGNQFGANAYYDSLGAATGSPIIDHTQGGYKQTGRSLDFALDGEGFFVIEGPGEQLYTRNGAFHIDTEGQLVTADNRPVVPREGLLKLPDGASTESLTVTPQGQVRVDGIEIGWLKVVRFDAPELLEVRGTTLMGAPPDVRPVDSEARVLQGTLESANVNPVQELVAMIAATRAHEAAQRAMSTISSAIERHTNQQGN